MSKKVKVKFANLQIINIHTRIKTNIICFRRHERRTYTCVMDLAPVTAAGLSSFSSLFSAAVAVTMAADVVVITTAAANLP